MKKVKLILSYDGTAYGGWQRQKEGKPTIQGEVEKVLQKTLSDDGIRICGSGRTDAGVHAYAQVAHFWAPDKIEGIPLVRALNGLLPKDITCAGASVVSDEFHAIASSEKKTYIYKIYNAEMPMALEARYKLWVKRPLSLALLNEMSEVLIGTHDFQCFQTSGSDVKTTVRTILQAEWGKEALHGRDICFVIEGNGFLKQMVRNIVGTLLFLEGNSDGPEVLREIIASKDRGRAFRSAPARGLFLKQVTYPYEVSKSLKRLD